MTWSKGWWTRFPAADVGRASLAAVLARIADRRPLREPDLGDPVPADLEARLRTVVAETFGVKTERIHPHAALANDLGIDPLDVIDLATRIESLFGVSYPEGELDALRTFEDLVLVTRALLSVRRADETPGCAPVQAYLHLAERDDGTGLTVDRVFPLTPYDGETVADDIAHAASFAQRELTIPATASGAVFAMLDDALLPSRLSGCRTTIRRVRDAAPGKGPATAERTPATNAAALRIARHAVDLLDSLSDERGTTLLHLASPDALFEAEVHAARSRSNRRVGAFRTIVRTYARLLGSALRVRLDAALERLGELGAIRGIADDRAMPHADILDAYHDLARALARYVWTLEVGLPDAALAPQQTCLSALVAATEAGGTERAVISSALARDVLTSSDRADMAALIAQQQAQLELAMRNAPDDIAVLLGGCSGDPTFQSVAEYESRLLSMRFDGAPGIDPAAWFRAMSGKLDRLHDVEVLQLDRLMRETIGMATRQ